MGEEACGIRTPLEYSGLTQGQTRAALHLWLALPIRAITGLPVRTSEIVSKSRLCDFCRLVTRVDPMKEDQSSQTALGVCFIRAVHQMIDEVPHILEDPSIASIAR